MRLETVLVLNSSPVARGGQGNRLDVIFWAVAIASSFLLTWSTLSTTIDRVDEGVLSMARLLPPTYWVGFALLLASTIIWYFGGETKAFHFLLVALWIGYVFLGPEMMEVHPHGYSSYGQGWGVAFVLAGRGRDYAYFPWLGFHYSFAMLTELGDIRFLDMLRVGVSVLHLTLAAGLIAFFGRVLPDKKSVLVATLAYLAMAAVPGGVGFTPHQMAFILMLFSLSLLASLDASLVINRLVLIGFFSGMVITHGLSALVVVYVAAMAAIARWKRSAVGRWSLSTTSLSLLFGTIFFAWLLYSSDSWFPRAVRAFRDTVLREPLTFTSPFGHVSPTQAGHAEISLLTLAFLAVLLVWLISVVATRGFWNGLSRDRIFPLLVVSGLPVLITSTGNFSFEGFVRIFFYASPFMAWFLAGESAAKRSVAVFLLLLLGLGFVLLYSREFEELPTSQQFAGANSLVAATRPNASLIQGDCLPPQQLANVIDGPITACPVLDPVRKGILAPSASCFAFAVLSEFGERTATFAFGKPWWESLRDSVVREGLAKIYSNGRYNVFIRQALPCVNLGPAFHGPRR
jgi:hypothetical protein